MINYQKIINAAYVAMALLRVRIKPNDKALLAALLQISEVIDILDDLTKERSQ